MTDSPKKMEHAMKELRKPKKTAVKVIRNGKVMNAEHVGTQVK
jgi:hypothetical protein